MLSFSKLLTLVLVVLAVWYGYRWVARVNAVRAAREREVGGNSRPGGRRIPAEDMEKCRACGTYVSAQSATSCGRGDCPYAR